MIAMLVYSSCHMPIILYFGRTNEGTGYLTYIIIAGFLQLFELSTGCPWQSLMT